MSSAYYGQELASTATMAAAAAVAAVAAATAYQKNRNCYHYLENEKEGCKHYYDDDEDEEDDVEEEAEEEEDYYKRDSGRQRRQRRKGAHFRDRIETGGPVRVARSERFNARTAGAGETRIEPKFAWLQTDEKLLALAVAQQNTVRRQVGGVMGVGSSDGEKDRDEEEEEEQDREEGAEEEEEEDEDEEDDDDDDDEKEGLGQEDDELELSDRASMLRRSRNDGVIALSGHDGPESLRLLRRQRNGRLRVHTSKDDTATSMQRKRRGRPISARRARDQTSLLPEVTTRSKRRGQRRRDRSASGPGSYRTASGQRPRISRLFDLSPAELRLRRHLLETCGVLSRLDARLGDRQTRVVVCVDTCGETGSGGDTGGATAAGSGLSQERLGGRAGLGSGLGVGVSAALVKLAAFAYLVDRLQMVTPQGGDSAAVSILLNPRSQADQMGRQMSGKEKKSVDSDRQQSTSISKSTLQGVASKASQNTTWSPNLVLLLTATETSPWRPLTSCCSTATTGMETGKPGTREEEGRSSGREDVGDSGRGGAAVSAGAHLSTVWQQGAVFSWQTEAWRVVHNACHLPVYLEELPPGPDTTADWLADIIANEGSIAKGYLTRPGLQAS
ncbi:unnamed protein product [Protopolystoma xenopodis]|uniref:Uncharacterized protein n=1 Tax=Protopolystoma xenopodis TaxID=117903 RepID=A0A3S5BA24_9PLAT|nr:unnamed protein product [Protopolystoma xenopodis]